MVVKDDLLEQVLLLTRQMREQAQQAAWEEAEQTEVQRSRLIAECFDGEEAFGDQRLAANKVQEIIRLDAEIMAIGERSRGEIRTQLNRLQQGRQVAKAYRRFSR
ncbi:flagellar protein FliT [endosymbiont of Ridgeia piscesae]|jgi:hypothetical protein|uniref:Flagellar protein FliT n=1 Tax=endosymbiont of Ridgeia piscesae TaxID=54398 RepID=A0A0T5Z579_9GAMM|nr:flagellar protein FliT [endosymbiont of Ridgeia piscesae]KRT56512.1 Flagellar protein FliT [endosymbiont of Ridgeia piscesae]KRT57734.1 protein FliT [endosymbiont of Ridgeia piscesae]